MSDPLLDGLREVPRPGPRPLPAAVVIPDDPSHSRLDSEAPEGELTPDASAEVLVCVDCGAGAAGDEDMCCLSCGRDLIRVVGDYAADRLIEAFAEKAKEGEEISAKDAQRLHDLVADLAALRIEHEAHAALLGETRGDRDRLRDILACERGERAPTPWERNDIDPKREGIAWYRRWEADGSEPGDDDTEHTRVAWVRHDSDVSLTEWCWEIETPINGVLDAILASAGGFATALEAIEAADLAAKEVAGG